MRKRQYDGFNHVNREIGGQGRDTTTNATNQGSIGLQNSNPNATQHSIPLSSVFNRILDDLTYIPVSSGIEGPSQGNIFVEVEPTKKRKPATGIKLYRYVIPSIYMCHILFRLFQKISRQVQRKCQQLAICEKE